MVLSSFPSDRRLMRRNRRTNQRGCPDIRSRSLQCCRDPGTGRSGSRRARPCSTREQQDTRALPDESARNRQAEALASSGYDRELVGKFHGFGPIGGCSMTGLRSANYEVTEIGLLPTS